MNNQAQFTLDEIIIALQNLGLEYKLDAHSIKKLVPNSFRFASLKRVIEFGIYFSINGFAKKQGVKNSIIISDVDVDALNIVILVSDPQLVFYKLMNYFFSEEQESSIHATAIIDPQASLGSNVTIGPYCVVGRSKIGSNVKLSSHVVVEDNCEIGNNSHIESHTTIGATGVAWCWDHESGKRIVQPQIGGVLVEDDVFIGTSVTIVRGSINEYTKIGAGTVMSHGVKIGHGCIVGEMCHFASNIALAGNVKIGSKSFLGSGVVIRPQITLPDDTIVGAGAVVVKSEIETGLVIAGCPAKPIKKEVGKSLSGVPRSN